jgi:hypothetical protein
MSLLKTIAVIHVHHFGLSLHTESSSSKLLAIWLYRLPITAQLHKLVFINEFSQRD